MNNRRGQAMVEAAISLCVLFLLIVCGFRTFEFGIRKIRAIDQTFMRIRKEEVLPGYAAPWLRAWPGAPLQPAPSWAILSREQFTVYARLHANHDEVFDAF